MKTVDELRADTPVSAQSLTSKQVTEALQRHQIRHVLVGGHALGEYGVVRNTEAVAVIAVGLETAAEAIAAGHGHLTVVRDHGAMNIAIVDPANVTIAEIISSSSGAACAYALETQVTVNGLPVPSVDALMALKFEAFTGNRPQEKRFMDVSDLVCLIKKFHATDPERMRHRVDTIAALVEKDAGGDPTRGAARWRALHDDILAGRPITV